MKLKTLIASFLIWIIASCVNEKPAAQSEVIIHKDSVTAISIDTVQTQNSNKPAILSNNCDYENNVTTLGMGLVIAPSRLDIYNDSLLIDKLISMDMHSITENICSKFFMPEYGIMHFICLGKTDKSYKILVNYSSIKYVPVTKSYVFKSWEEYILQSFGIRRLSEDSIAENLPLRKEPKITSDTIAIPKGLEMFCPMEIRGDWVKVKYDCFYNDENNLHEGEPCHSFIEECANPLTGWLMWKKENKLLIDIFLMP